jgi:hypothetical protein
MRYVPSCGAHGILLYTYLYIYKVISSQPCPIPSPSKAKAISSPPDIDGDVERQGEADFGTTDTESSLSDGERVRADERKAISSPPDIDGDAERQGEADFGTTDTESSLSDGEKVSIAIGRLCRPSREKVSSAERPALFAKRVFEAVALAATVKADSLAPKAAAEGLALKANAPGPLHDDAAPKATAHPKAKRDQSSGASASSGVLTEPHEKDRVTGVPPLRAVAAAAHGHRSAAGCAAGTTPRTPPSHVQRRARVAHNAEQAQATKVVPPVVTVQLFTAGWRNLHQLPGKGVPSPQWESRPSDATMSAELKRVVCPEALQALLVG